MFKIEPAALDHETVNDAMKDSAVVELVVHVGEEVGNRLRGFFGIKLEGDDAVVKDVQFNAGLAHEITHFSKVAD